MSESVRVTLTEQYNLDDPLPVQYVKYIGGVVQGDFGTDFRGAIVTAKEFLVSPSCRGRRMRLAGTVLT